MIIVFGSNGQVGSALLEQLGKKAIGFSRAEADFTQPDAVITLLASYTPTAIINAAAYTAVDKAESEHDIATTINATTPGRLAEYCTLHNIPLIHFSTDYVFSGEGSTPYKESDPTAPVNTYGLSKYLGEKSISDSRCNHLIFRTSWVYDHTHKNFLNTMLQLGKTREELTVVNDQIGAPTYAEQLATAVLKAFNNAQAQAQFPSGVYHLCHAGSTSWHGFATRIFELGQQKGLDLAILRVLPIPSSNYPTPAKRPLNSRLDCSKAASILGVRLPDWQEGLKSCMEKR